MKLRGGRQAFTTQILDIVPSTGSADGGETVRVYFTRLAPGDVITIDGAPATITDGNYGITNAWADITTPAGDEGVVDVAVVGRYGNDTAAAGFEYTAGSGEDPGTIYAEWDDDVTLTDFSTDGNPYGNGISISTDQHLPGQTRSIKCAITSPSVEGRSCGALFDFTVGLHGTSNPALDLADGIYIRWSQYFSNAALAELNETAPALKTHQMKQHLFRRLQGSGQPGFVMAGVGADFLGTAKPKFVIDNGILNITGGTPDVSYGDGIWVKNTLWYKRTAATGLGRARCWINDSEIFDVSNAVMGSDVSSDDYRVLIGAAYTESDSAVETYIAGIRISSGPPG